VTQEQCEIAHPISEIQKPPLDAGLEALNAVEEVDDRTAMIKAQCRALLHGYDKLYRNEWLKPVLIEKTLTGPIIDPITGKRTYGWKIGGKLDLICEDEQGRKIIMDHKTTSESIEGPDSDYWRHLAIDGQVSQYMLLAIENGIEVKRVIWDVMRKPTIRQKQAETIQEYEDRLRDDCTNVRPGFYFQRQMAPQLNDSILQYAKDLPQIAADIRESRKRLERMRATDTDAMPPMSTGSCFLYNTTCKFFGLCSRTDSLSNWVPKEKKHPEIPEVFTFDMLTHSRIRSWQACHRKHYYEYELGIKRHDQEEADALRFGTIWHLALEAWLHAISESGAKNGSVSEGCEIAQEGARSGDAVRSGGDREDGVRGPVLVEEGRQEAPAPVSSLGGGDGTSQADRVGGDPGDPVAGVPEYPEW
jgi:hypothetical protein